MTVSGWGTNSGGLELTLINKEFPDGENFYCSTFPDPVPDSCSMQGVFAALVAMATAGYCSEKTIRVQYFARAEGTLQMYQITLADKF